MIGSATAITPAASPSIAAKIAVAPWPRRSFAISFERADVDADRLHHGPIAERDLAPVYGSLHAFAGKTLKVVDLGEREIAIRGGAQDRRRERMLAAALETGCKLEQRFLADPISLRRFAGAERNGRAGISHSG